MDKYITDTLIKTHQPFYLSSVLPISLGMQLDPAAAAAAVPRASRRKRKDWRDSVYSVDQMISFVQKAHRISIHPFGGFYCLGVHKTLARFKSMFPDICVRKRDLVNMIDESCTRIQANERLMRNLPLLPRNQRRRIHTYAVDTVEELGQPFLMHHINIADFIFILDQDLQNRFWVLVELTPPELVLQISATVSIKNGKFHEVNIATRIHQR
jgi:hypothetical protein